MNKTLADLYVDISIKRESESPLLRQGDIPIMSKGSLSLISGKPKSRKTFFVASVAAAMIGESPQLGMESVGVHKILWIDTEQSVSCFEKGIKRSLRMAGISDAKNDSLLIPLSFASISTEDRTAKLEEAIVAYKPELVIIDGIRDLLYDFNDIKETAKLKDLIIGLYQTYNLHICCVIHQNKADKNARGHLGGEFTNKAETVFLLESIDDKTIVTPGQCRNKPFNEFAFVINEKAETERVSIYHISRKKSRLTQELKQIFIGKEDLRYTEITSLLQAAMHVAKKTAEKYLKEAMDEGMIEKNQSDKYTLSKGISKED
ncbi:MAG: AAA family ATPase [Bacteroides sp.]